MGERQHYSKSQMLKAGSVESLQMVTFPYRKLIVSFPKNQFNLAKRAKSRTSTQQ